MECEICETEMELINTTHDYHDPGDYYGHGQTEETVWACPKCNYTQPYIKEDYE